MLLKSKFFVNGRGTTTLVRLEVYKGEYAVIVDDEPYYKGNNELFAVSAFNGI